ncbi:MAG: DNA topoisomerase I [archaeon]
MKTLIICEKPDAARHLAAALSDSGEASQTFTKGVPTYEIRGPNSITVCSAIGHLLTVDAKQGSTRKHFPVLDLMWKPKYLVEKGCGRHRVWLDIINKLASRADRVVNACDYDTEGSLIGAMILKHACGESYESATRMRFSTLTRKELREAYENLTALDLMTVDAGMCRHEVDWLYGVNLSRVLTESSLKFNRRYHTLSTGRVQGPTLRIVADREKEISCYVPTPFWSIKAIADVDGQHVPVEYERGTVSTKIEADRIASESCQKVGVVEKKAFKELRISPPPPFDLSSLQTEAYRHFGLTPSYTLSIAEKLYLQALISYPRTSSEKLPPSIGYVEILGALAQAPSYADAANMLLSKSTLRPSEGAKDDRAHPAIFPTGKILRALGSKEQKLYDLIVRRFLSTFGEPATQEIMSIIINSSGHKFSLRGAKILKEGWIDLYRPYAKSRETLIPRAEVGQAVRFVSVEAVQKFTTPKPRYNPSSLLRDMERLGLGTKATRASIIDTLYERGYISGNQITATHLGLNVTEALQKYCPKLLDTIFTRELEDMMEEIEKGSETRANVLIKTMTELKSIIGEAKLGERRLGQELSDSIAAREEAMTTLAKPCPKCGAKLMLIRSRTTRKRFIGCSEIKSNCGFSLPLPQRGRIRFLRKTCRTCGFQLIHIAEARRRWTTCPLCYVNRSTRIRNDVSIGVPPRIAVPDPSAQQPKSQVATRL